MQLPKFKTDVKAELADTLKDLGMVDAFLEGRADFSKMTARDVYISRVMQRCYIEVCSPTIRNREIVEA